MVNQKLEAAIPQDIGSAPASMEAGKVTDAHGCMEDHSLQQADAEQAYVQTLLEGEGRGSIYLLKRSTCIVMTLEYGVCSTTKMERNN